MYILLNHSVPATTAALSHCVAMRHPLGGCLMCSFNSESDHSLSL